MIDDERYLKLKVEKSDHGFNKLFIEEKALKLL